MSSSTSSNNSAGRQPTYRGVRRRNGGKWVSEIREPKKPNRIWLGTFPRPEMAAVAYDVAALALKGRDAELNFPNLADSFPIPVSTTPRDIQAAAANAAAAAGAAADSLSVTGGNNHPIIPSGATGSTNYNHEFVDEELIFNMPNLLRNMAEGMLLSPPRLDLTAADINDDQNMSTYSGDNHNLWSYYP